MEITVGILAGGKSTRMGINKAFLPFRETSFIETIAEECEDFSKIILSVNDLETYKNIGYELVQDEKSGFGPLEGVYQILKKADTKFALILAADMPYINKNFLNKFCSCLDNPVLLRNDQGEMPGCIVLRADNMLEPLCSLYSRTTLPFLKEMREQEEHKLRMLYERVYTRYIDIESLGYTKQIITNINTQEEYKKIIEAN
ncbi:molybdenum cofactor guanylyltransferase [Anaerocolumna aminovalerica]|uniref:Probable molybdenum cofactor guanylyltransferase n=1 Tax=Anaerocolumna aminovalerica TaxID=1527 RepID=A0A1I5D8W4_9FIRM|nr:molybdenum cofactor guanylyltransferase [Anaerocolumna aminovalerica]SFN95689.1 molybdenum cofactor guanylyltransferase [Anaerocolumna aminovalerica]